MSVFCVLVFCWFGVFLMGWVLGFFVLIQFYYRRMNRRRMLKNCNRVNHITGETGQSLGEGTACISGVMLQPWNYLMVVMDGSDLSWMENWPQCIPVAALKEDPIVQVVSLQFKAKLSFETVIFVYII